MIKRELIYNWLINKAFTLALFLLVLGFILMALGNLGERAGTSVLALTVSPILLLSGYSLIIFAIMKKPF
jgi:hypothetical protein